MLAQQAFYFLRHGETDWNAEGRLQGQSDIPLNETGRAQANAVRATIAELEISTICVSPLSRAFETAEVVRPDNGYSLNVIDELQEVTIGVRDGDLVGPWYQQWKTGEIALEGAETRLEFRQRAVAGINQALEFPGPVLIVSHGGVFGALKETLTIYPEVAISNCMLLQFDPILTDRTQWQISVLTPFDDSYQNIA